MFWAYDQSLRKSAYNEKTLHFISKTIRWIFRSWEVSWLKANDTSRYFYHSVQFRSSVVSDSLRPHGLQHTRLPCPSPTPRACSNSCPLSQWCHPIISSLSPSPPAFNLSQHEGLFKWVTSLHQVAKVLKFQQKHQPSNEYSGLISFRIDWFDLFPIQGTLKSLHQHHSSKTSILQCSAFFMVQLSHPYITIGKNHSFD